MKRLKRSRLYGMERSLPLLGRGLRFVLNSLVEPPPMIANVDRPFGLCLEEVIRVGPDAVFVGGWLWDSNSSLEELVLRTPAGQRFSVLESLHRFPRPDVEERYREHFGDGARGDHGFISLVTGVGSRRGRRWTMEVRLSTGERLQVARVEESPRWREARDRILRALPLDAPLDPELIKRCFATAVDWTASEHRSPSVTFESFEVGDLAPAPDVSVIIPLSGLELLQPQLARFADDPDIRRSEIIYLLRESGIEEAFRSTATELSRLYDVPFRGLCPSTDVGLAEAVDVAARQARGRRLLLLDSKVLPSAPGWLGRMDAYYASTPGIGALGCKLLYEDGSVQHAGVFFSTEREGDGLWSPVYPLSGLPGQHPDACRSRSVPAVSGACLMIDRALFEQVGGLRDRYIAAEFEDLDLCIRCREAGFRSMYLADVELFHLQELSPTSIDAWKRNPWSRLFNRWLLTRTWGDKLEARLDEHDGVGGRPERSRRVSTVTVVIPTLNAGPEFRDNLRLILDQEIEASIEVLVIDSGSSDGTVDFLRSQPVDLRQIEKSDFDHGLTRQLGVSEAAGEVVVFISQDARPADAHWLEPLVRCYSDPEVVGAYSRQTPRPDANPFVKHQLSRWVANREQRSVQYVGSRAEFEAMGPAERLDRVAFDNVSSSVWKQTALEIPFRSTGFGEDLDWGSRVVLAGHKIVYEPRSRVIHSHNHSIWQEYRRVYQDHRNLYRILGLHSVRSWRDVVASAKAGHRDLSNVVGNSDLELFSRMYWRTKALPFAFAQSLGQFLGVRSL